MKTDKSSRLDKTLIAIVAQASKDIFKFKYSRTVTPVSRLAIVGGSKTPGLTKLAKLKPDAYVKLCGTMPVLHYKTWDH